MATKKVIHEISFENEEGEYLDVTYSIEGYIFLEINTNEKFHITNEEDLDRIYRELKSLLKQNTEIKK